MENKIPSISGLATNVLTTRKWDLENKITNISSLIPKTDYNTKNTKIEKKINDHCYEKYITTPEFNTLAAGAFTARLAQANLVTETEFDNKLKSLNQKINSDKAKYLVVENELKKLQTFDLIYFRGKSHFEEAGRKNYLVFQPMNN